MSAEDTIKTALVVEGEKEYRDACKNVSSSMREIGSEMKLASATFAENEKSTEALTEKQKILQKQFDAQKDKVRAAEEALKKMKQGGLDAANPAVQKMQTNLNLAQAALIKTENELKNVGNELKNSKVNWGAVGEVVGKVGKTFGAALAGLGTIALGAASALAGLTVAGGKLADDLMTTATYTRQSTDQLQEYAYAARFIDVEIETLTKSMARNIKSMDAAKSGTGAAADAYKRLGVEVTDSEGNFRDSNDVYWEAIDALNAIENETERDALAMQLFGKSAQELNSIIEAGSEEFKALGAEARNMGFILSEEAVEALGAFDDKMQILDAGLEGLKNSASLVALPFLDIIASDGIGIMGAFSQGIQEAAGDISKMSSVIGTAISDILNLIINRLPEFIDMGITLVQSLVEGIAGNAAGFAEAAVKIVESLVTGIANLLPVLINGAVQIVVGLAQGLAASLPQLIPEIVNMMMTIVQTLIDNIPLLIDAALQIVLGLVQGIINAIPVLVAAIPQLIESVIRAILGAIPLLIQAGITLFISLVQALPQIITAIVSAIPQIIDGVITAIVESLPLIIQAGIDLFIALIGALPEIILAIVNAIPQIIDGIVNGFIGAIPQIIEGGVQLFIALIENLPTIIANIVAAIPQIITAIVDAIGGYFSTLAETGLNLIKGLWEGISNAAEWLWDKISGFFSQLTDKIKNFFGIASPSKLFASFGEFMAQGLAVGFDNEIDTVANAIQDGIDSIIPVASDFAQIGADMAQGLGDGFAREMHNVDNAIQSELQGAIPVNINTEKRNRQNSAPTIKIENTQNIYAADTSYAGQQREAMRNLKNVVREVMG